MPSLKNGNSLPDDDFESKEAIEEEWTEDEESSDPNRDPGTLDDKPRPLFDPAFVTAEIQDLRRFAQLAHKVATNAKGQELLNGLEAAFSKAAELGAKRKAIIFTESRRTQSYLFDLLSEHGYKDQLMLMNSTNADPLSTRIYQAWLERNRGTDAISGSPTADRKAAIVEEFRGRATILIATESAAEGVNLQFCSLVVNYDLPWNPQRIEQRIGRCHRYGQKHDVVVVNFLNKRNAADQRVYALLKDKFKLFEGVFGSSDEVLGALESGVDLEKRIAAVYQTCRTTSEIESAFNELQAQLEESIQTRLEQTRRTLLENFDQEVHDRLRIQREKTSASLDERQKWLLNLTRFELGDEAVFDDGHYRFTFAPSRPDWREFAGEYDFDWRRAEESAAHFYRLGSPLADRLVACSAQKQLEPATVIFQYHRQSGRISAMEPLRGRSGWLRLTRLTVTALEPQDFLFLTGLLDGGQELDEDLCRKLLTLPAAKKCEPASRASGLDEIANRRKQAILAEIDRRNGLLFEAEIDKLERWSDDLKLSLEREVKGIEKELREVKRESRFATDLASRLAAERRKRDLESRKSQKLKELFDARANIDKQHDELVTRLEAELQGQQTVQDLWTVRWSLE